MKDTKAKAQWMKLFELFVCFVMLSMVIMIFVNASLRYLFNQGIAATEELSRFAFVWVSSLGAILGYYENKHVGVDMLVAKLHGIAKLIIQSIAEGLSFFALAVIAYGGWRYFSKTAFLESAALPIPMGIITVSALVMAVTMMPKTFMNFKAHWVEYSNYKQSYGLERGE